MERGREVMEELYHTAPYKHWRSNIVPLIKSANEFDKDYVENTLDYELSYYADFLGRGYVDMPVVDRNFANDYFNEDFEYKVEHQRKLIDLYDRYWVIPYLIEERILCAMVR